MLTSYADDEALLDRDHGGAPRDSSSSRFSEPILVAAVRTVGRGGSLLDSPCNRGADAADPQRPYS